MFDFNLYDNPKPLKIFLCRPDTHKAICELNGIVEDTCRLKLAGNNQYELNFDYYRYMDINGERIETNGYDKLLIDTELFVEKFGYFKLKYPPYTDDGDKEMKSITAHSIDCELENKELVNFKVNTGEKDSAEYLVTYDDGETESLLNEYTGLPYDYIVFYNTFPEQLTAFKSFVLGGGAIDDATRNVTDATRIAKFMEMIKLIPRLFSKVVYDSTNDEHSLIEYMKIFYKQDGVTVDKIQYKRSVLCARIDELFTFYTKYRNQLSLLTLAIEKCNCNWSVGDIDSSLVNKRFQFNVSENIYAFLTNDLASKTKAIVDFDRINRKINVVLIENLGNDSGVFLSKNSLINSVNITCNEEKLCTRYNVTGGNDIDLRYVNFGHSRIDNIDYYLSVRDDSGNLVYVSEELAEKYRQYKTDIEIAREKYIEYTKQYNQLNQDIRAFKYRLPNDEVKNDWDTYRLDELEGLVTVYNNLLCTLKTLYNEDYGDRGYTNGEINENFMRTTEYWYDYYAYKQVLDQLDEAKNCKLNDERYSEIDNEQIIAKIKAFETEWSLYGTVELENKIKSYIERMNVMIDGGSIIIQANTDYTPKTWSNLSVEEKKNYNSLEINYYYTEYYKIYSEYVSCKTYLDSLYPQLTQMESDLADVTEDRNNLLKYVTLEGYDRDELADLVDLDTITSEIQYSFTATEIGIITSLYIDSNYSNENILTTSLDDTVSTVDVEKELLEDAEEELSKVSQPQLTITTSIDNLLAIPEFKGYNFDIYNYVMLEYYKDYYVKLRLYEIEFNPVMPEDEISVVFTNYINSASERSDLSYILQQSSGGGSSSGGSGGGSDGNFGESDDIDVTISNTMLAKLLNTEMFGSRVTDVVLDTINIKTLTARTATFKDLANGTTTIDGGCITTGVIKSDNYNGTSTTNSNGLKSYDIDNTTGSIIILKDPSNNNVSRNGTFNFGGGKLKWDGSNLTAQGRITAHTLSTGSKTGYYDAHDGLFIDKDGNIAVGSANTVEINKDGTFNFGNGQIIWNGTALSIGGYNTDNSYSGYVVDTTGYDNIINLYGYGTPTNVGYSASEHNGKVYLNTSSGYLYQSNGNSWVFYRPQGAETNIVLPMISKGAKLIKQINLTAENLSINANKIDLTGYVTISSLGANGTTTIDGGRIQTGVIKSRNYGNLSNANDPLSNTTGSILVLDDGTFSFGGGKLKWDNTKLSIAGELSAGGKDSQTSTVEGTFIDTNGNIFVGGYDTNYSDVQTNGCAIKISNSGTIYTQNYIMDSNSNVLYTQQSQLTGGTLTFYRNGIRHGRINAGIMGTTKTLGLVTDNNAILGIGGFKSNGDVGLHTLISSTTNSNGDLVGKVETDNVYADNIYTDYIYSQTSGVALDFKSTLHIGYYDIQAFNYTTFVKVEANPDKLYLGTHKDNDIPTYIRGSKIYLDGDSGVYLATGGAATTVSDENVKTLYEITSKYENFFKRLNPTLYKYNQGGHRLHMGFGARAVEQALLSSGLTTEEFAGVVIEREHTIPSEVSYSGEDEYYEALYSLRYEEFTALNTYMIQKLMTKIQELETEIEQLKD